MPRMGTSVEPLICIGGVPAKASEVPVQDDLDRGCRPALPPGRQRAAASSQSQGITGCFLHQNLRSFAC